MKDLKSVLPYYLNYGLKVVIEGDGILRELNSIHAFTINTIPQKHGFKYCLFESVKPLLLPMSALTEPLEGGVIPMDELYELFGSTSGFGKQYWKDDVFKSLVGYDQDIRLKYLEYLFANHFDVFGLIEQGLAIDKRINQQQ